MVLDVLQCRLRDHLAIYRLLFRVAEQSELQAEIGKTPPISARDAAGGIKGAVLPSAVRIGSAQYAFGILQLFRHLDNVERHPRTAIEASPRRISLCEFGLRQLIGFIHRAGIANPERPVPIVRYAIVAKATQSRPNGGAAGGSP